MLDKVAKALGRDTVEEMDAMDETELKKVVVEATSAMKQVKEELEANKDYQAAKYDVSAFSQGKREVDKRQKARVQYALDRIDGLGKLDPMAYQEWRKQALKTKEEIVKRAAAKLKEELEQAGAIGIDDNAEESEE